MIKSQVTTIALFLGMTIGCGYCDPAVKIEEKSHPPAAPRQNWRGRLEELKNTDPARYAQMTNRFAQWRQRRTEQARNKIDFLSSIDTSLMSAEARKTHDDLQKVIAKREEFEQRLQLPNLSDDERSKLMSELHSTHRDLVRLNDEERKNLINVATEELSVKIQRIIDATENNAFNNGSRRGSLGGQGGR